MVKIYGYLGFSVRGFGLYLKEAPRLTRGVLTSFWYTFPVKPAELFLCFD